MGCAWFSGRRWKGNIFTADVVELPENEVLEIHVTIVFPVPKGNEYDVFSCAHGSVKLAGDGHEVRTSDRFRQNPEHGEKLQ